MLHPARGVPQAGFTSGSFPQISISRSITATRLWAIGTRKNEHEHARPFPASDSPRRASRYDLLAGAASVACVSTRSQPRSHNPTLCPTIRSAALFMVADRNAPSRGKPLTARLVGRRHESVAERTAAQGRLISLYLSSVCLHVSSARIVVPITTGLLLRARRDRTATVSRNIRGDCVAGVSTPVAVASSTFLTPTGRSRSIGSLADSSVCVSADIAAS